MACAVSANVIPDAPDVLNAKIEHWRAHALAAAANGQVSSLPALVLPAPVVSVLPQPVQDTPEVAAARAAHLAAHAAVAPRVVVVPVAAPLVAQPLSDLPDTADVWNAKVEHWRAHAAAAAANGVISSLPPLVVVQANPGLPQPVQDTPEVAAARAAHMAALQAALARSVPV